jgi:hypothetical protein
MREIKEEPLTEEQFISGKFNALPIKSLDVFGKYLILGTGRTD